MPAFSIDPLGEIPSKKLLAAIEAVEKAGGQVTAVVPFQDDLVVVHTPYKKAASEKRITK